MYSGANGSPNSSTSSNQRYFPLPVERTFIIAVFVAVIAQVGGFYHEFLYKHNPKKR